MRVRNKIFATFPEDGETINLKTSPQNLDALVMTDANAFRPVWGNRWIGVRLSRVNRRALKDLIEEAWRQAAPKSLVKAWDGGGKS